MDYEPLSGREFPRYSGIKTFVEINRYATAKSLPDTLIFINSAKSKIVKT